MTARVDFTDGLILRLVNASKGKSVSEKGTNFMLAVVKGVDPRDQIEAMLAAQMAEVHMASMTFARRLANVDNIPQQDSAERAFNKLTRTFAVQVEGLKNYRSKGEQKMTVQHVHVAEGGQAIVGNVNTPAEVVGAREKNGEQPHARQIAHAPGVAMPCTIEAKRSGILFQAPTVRGASVCRMHGAGSGAPKATETPSSTAPLGPQRSS